MTGSILDIFKKNGSGYGPILIAQKILTKKNNWRKLNDRRPEYTDMVDKYKFKDFVARRAGSKYVIPLLGVWNNPDDIDYKNLPNKFVLKVNHAGGIVVCRDKACFDSKKANKDLWKTFKDYYFYRSREWPYKNVERKVICEQYIGENLTDYKNYCFNGNLKYTLVWENKSRPDGRSIRDALCLKKGEVLCKIFGWSPDVKGVDIAMIAVKKVNEQSKRRVCPAIICGDGINEESG